MTKPMRRPSKAALIAPTDCGVWDTSGAPYWCPLPVGHDGPHDFDTGRRNAARDGRAIEEPEGAGK